ncbi:MAG: cation:proton antiporter [Pseudobdellovibrionaceae bacterium]
MVTSNVILILGLLYFCAHGFAYLFQKTKTPDVLILMVIGLIIGPIIGWVGPENFGGAGEVLTTIALTVILFEGGLSLKLKILSSAVGATLALTLITAFATIVVVAAASSTFLGLSPELALLCGAILCGTSSAVVIPMVQALKLSEKSSTILVLESALTDVICIVLSFSLLRAIEEKTFSYANVIGQIGLSLSIAVIIGIVGGALWLKLWPLVRRFPTTTFTTIAYAFIMYGATELFGLSGAIATLVFGFTITNIPDLISKIEFPRMTDVERKFFQEIVFLLKTFFFVYLGISIQFSNYYLVFVAFLVVPIIYLARIFIVRWVAPKETSVRDASLASFLIPKGLAAAVLASLPKQYGLPEGGDIQLFVYSVIFFSILFTAVLVPLAETKNIQKLLMKLLKKTI